MRSDALRCSLNCFLDFMEARSQAQRERVIKQYKKGSTGPARGMIVYYRPALSAMRGRLSPDGSLEETLSAIQKSCFVNNWDDKLVEARTQANFAAYRAFRNEFGDKKLRIFSNPRLQFAPIEELAINMQPEFYGEVDGVTMMWKFGMTKKSRAEETVRSVLQMLSEASRHKGISLNIQQIRFLDVRSGKTYVEDLRDADLRKKLEPVAQAFATAWKSAA